MKPLVLWLQKSQTKADVTELSNVVSIVVGRLRYLVSKDPKEKFGFTDSELGKLMYTEEVLNSKLDDVTNLVESLPTVSRLRSNNGDNARVFQTFTEKIYKPFISEVAEEVESEIQVDPVTEALGCLDVRKFPARMEDLANFGVNAIQTLIQHFGEPREASNPSSQRNNRADPLIDKNATLQEFTVFKEVAYELRAKRVEEINLKIQKLSLEIKNTLKIYTNKAKLQKMRDEIALLESSVENMNLSELMARLSDSHKLLFPNIVFLLEVAIICPISNATVERLFSFLKLVKSRIRSQLGDLTLDKLLRIQTEGPAKLDNLQLETLVNNFKVYSEEKTASGKIRINL